MDSVSEDDWGLGKATQTSSMSDRELVDDMMLTRRGSGMMTGVMTVSIRPVLVDASVNEETKSSTWADVVGDLEMISPHSIYTKKRAFFELPY